MHPTHGVQNEGIFRKQYQRTLDQHQCFIETVCLISQGIAQSVVGMRIIRLQLDQATHISFMLVDQFKLRCYQASCIKKVTVSRHVNERRV